MNVMRSFTLRSLRRNKKRTVVTIIGVIISVAMITAVTTLSASFLGYLQRGSIADSGNWHAELTDVPSANLAAVENSEAVDAAILSRDIGFSPIADSENFSKQYLFLREYSAGGFSQMSIRLTEGRLPEKNGEILISQNILKGSDLEYSVGDTLMLTTGAIIDGSGTVLQGNEYAGDAYDEKGNVVGSPTFQSQGTATLTIVGIMEAPNFEQGWSMGYGLLGFLDPESLSPSDHVNVYITASHLSRDIYKQVDTLMALAGDDKTGAEFNDNLLRYSGVVEWDNVYVFLQGFMLVIILIVVIASVSLIYNAFAMSVSERARQLGLLASVGATRSQKRASVYFEGFFVGVIGIPVGILAGLGGIGITLAAIQPLLDSFINVSGGVKLTLVVPLSALALTVLFSVITIFISVYRPARRASKIAPIDAIRQTQDVRLTRRSVKTSRLTRHAFGFEAEIALKNLKRSRKKYRATVVSLVISLVLFLTVSSYADLSGRYTDVVNEGYNYDIMLQYQNVSDAQRGENDAQIAALDLVNDFSANAALYGYTQLNETQLSDYTRTRIAQPEDIAAGQAVLSVTLLSLDSVSFAAYAQSAGVRSEDYSDTSAPKGILINYGQEYASVTGNNVKKEAGEIVKLRTGDTLSFTAGDFGSPVGEAKQFTLGTITTQRPMGVLTGTFSSVVLVVSEGVLDSVLHSYSPEEQSQLSENYGLPRYTTYMTTDEDQRLEAKLNELAQTMPASGYYIYNIKSMARSEQNLSTFLGVFVYGFIALISLICIANIFNTVSTNIGLRRRELAMLRSVGMTPKGFGRMLRFESIFYGLKGLLWGLPISLAVAFLLYNMQMDVLGMQFTLPWVSYIVAILMILLIVLASMAYSSHRIKKENIIDALKQETF